MPEPEDLSARSLALLSDLYQLTMASGYWKAAVGANLDGAAAMPQTPEAP